MSAEKQASRDGASRQDLLRFGSWYAVRSAVVDDEQPRIGARTRVWHHAHVCAGAVIGEDCIIGQNAYVGPGVRVGDGCKLQNNVNVYQGVTLEEAVFCGPSMTFTNLSEPLPRAAIPRGGMIEPEGNLAGQTPARETYVKRGASFGAGCVVVCGHEIGEYAFVGAGAVVVRDVRPFEIVVGNPARRIGYACVCGARLEFGGDAMSAAGGPRRTVCRHSYLERGASRVCGREYVLDHGTVACVEGG